MTEEKKNRIPIPMSNYGFIQKYSMFEWTPKIVKMVIFKYKHNKKQ